MSPRTLLALILRKILVFIQIKQKADMDTEVSRGWNSWNKSRKSMYSLLVSNIRPLSVTETALGMLRMRETISTGSK